MKDLEKAIEEGAENFVRVRDFKILKNRDYIANQCFNEGLKILSKPITISDNERIINKELVPIRCGELTPIESSGYTLDEIGNSDLVDFSKFD